jgi:Ser/Thr protein kinase RdoA (MazF antagonist)
MRQLTGLMDLVIDPDELLGSLGPAIEKEWMLRVRGARLLEGGMNSVTFAFDSDDGAYVAKWVSHRDGPALRNGTLAARLMERSGIRAGKPRLTIDHQSTAAVDSGHVALLEFVPGTPLSSHNEDQVDWGGTLGRVHAAGVQPADGTFFGWVERDGKNGTHPSWVWGDKGRRCRTETHAVSYLGSAPHRSSARSVSQRR